MATDPNDILGIAFDEARAAADHPLISDAVTVERIAAIAQNRTNRACVRLMLACALAKCHRPQVDIRKPYTEIEGDDTYSGRHYDEAFLSAFIAKHQLPCNPTTAFLTPALRNRATLLTPDEVIQGRPRSLYLKTFQLLADVHEGRITARKLLSETLRALLIYGQKRQQRITALLASVHSRFDDAIPLSSEAIVHLIEQHLSRPKASRLPVLVVTAAYRTAEDNLRERVLPLQPHTAADEQTGALGDVEITLVDDNNIITVYEMKMKPVTRVDVDRALQKIARSPRQIDNYLFITTDTIDSEIARYASRLYDSTGGIEIAILDCIGFLRHFLHLFHRQRTRFLDEYQTLLLAESESAVRQELKEVFLILRQDAESALNT